MVTLRAIAVAAALVASLILPSPGVRAAVPEYKLGDIAADDIVTPLPLLVQNPDATEVLKQKVAQQVQFIVRLTPASADEAEAELRQNIAAVRAKFMSLLAQALIDRAPAAANLDTTPVAKTIREVARESPKGMPLERLAPLWVHGSSDESVLESLLQPLRDVMAQPIVGNKTENPLPANQAIRLLPVKSPSESPTLQELETAGPTVSGGKVMTLWRARRLVETHFPPGQEALGAFAASFVRPNAYPDPGLTDVLRARRMEGILVNDTYEAGQVIVRNGQTIDRRALSALAALREKTLIGSLQIKLEQEQSVAGRIRQNTKWAAAILGAVCIAIVLILVRRGHSSRLDAAFVSLEANSALRNSELAAVSDGAKDVAWQQRAMIAEAKMERAHEAIRTGVLGWMREKIFQTLFRQRSELLTAQQMAEAEMGELERRLEQLHAPLQERISAYERRIEQLEENLSAKGEENRELIRARIALAKRRLTMEREQRRFGAN